MGFLKRLFGKKDSKENTPQEPGKKTDTVEKTDEPKAKDRHQKYHVSMNRDEESENFNMWRVRLEQSDKTIKHFRTQEEAIDYAEGLADDSGSSVVIHKKDGSIRRQNYKKNS